ncbi:MAG: hypothetical protein SPG13_00975 [Peptostreptococcus porci]|uniref:Uncharacterized protein n=1 Tax=Peptostreptococcus porci TaxID=2652282 RepID=A0A6N7X252_9FIRM|nr:hypothetical protein [Peptostreptococcus porci]MDY5479011.1 hypothetical protein [Peptostreptococcus porci]MST63078.1 hypothetical protein [Peptostreptococcus porci]
MSNKKDLVDIEFKDILKNSMTEINPLKEDRFFCIILFVSLFAYIIFFIGEENTTSRFIEINSIMFETGIALFALGMTIYTFLMSFSVKATLLELSKREYPKEEKNYLNKFLNCFESTLVLLFVLCFYTFLIRLISIDMLRMILVITGKLVPAIVTFVYLFISIRIIYEVKNLLYNAYIFIRFNVKQMFNNY